MMTNKLAKVVALSVGMCATSNAAEEWVNKVDFGLSLAKGNTDNSLVRTALKTKKKEAADLYSAMLSYSYGEENGEATEDEILAKAKYQHIFSGKNFYGVGLGARRDEFADIDYRCSLNLTYGYYWIDTEATLFSTEFGLGLTVEDKGEGRDAYLNGLLDQHFEHQLNEHASLFQNFSFSPRLGDVSDYRVEFDAGIETQINDTISFKVSFEDRYESKPAEGKKSNDIKVVAGISYKF